MQSWNLCVTLFHVLTSLPRASVQHLTPTPTPIHPYPIIAAHCHLPVEEQTSPHLLRYTWGQKEFGLGLFGLQPRFLSTYSTLPNPVPPGRIQTSGDANHHFQASGAPTWAAITHVKIIPLAVLLPTEAAWLREQFERVVPRENRFGGST